MRLTKYNLALLICLEADSKKWRKTKDPVLFEEIRTTLNEKKVP